MVFNLKIDGLSNPREFVDKWSKIYKYKLEYKYNGNIHRGFDTDEVLMELMRWKNGTGDVIRDTKMKRVNEFMNIRNDLKTLKGSFNLTKFETLVRPEKDSTIWKIFLLHLMNPDEFPIFDQHVYRSFYFFKTGEIKELPISKYKEVYFIYKEEYIPWFNDLKLKYGLTPRMMDKSFFSFGQVLKRLKGVPKTILRHEK